MRPIDYRNETWAAVQGRLCGMLQAVHEALIAHGPCTTRHLAFESGMDILAVRPRVTDLCHLGLVRLSQEGGEGSPRVPGSHEGVYEAVPIAEAMVAFERERRAAHERQLSLRLTA